MLFSIQYNDKIFYLYEYYYDKNKKKNIQIFKIEKNKVILKYSNEKILYDIEYLNNLNI